MDTEGINSTRVYTNLSPKNSRMDILLQMSIYGSVDGDASKLLSRRKIYSLSFFMGLHWLYNILVEVVLNHISNIPCHGTIGQIWAHNKLANIFTWTSWPQPQCKIKLLQHQIFSTLWSCIYVVMAHWICDSGYVYGWTKSFTINYKMIFSTII